MFEGYSNSTRFSKRITELATKVGVDLRADRARILQLEKDVAEFRKTIDILCSKLPKP